MIDLTALIILTLLAGWCFSFLLRGNHKKEHRSSITRIDDKNWIVNGEFVSLEEDTPINRLRQKQEDRKYYWAYERERRSEDDGRRI